MSAPIYLDYNATTPVDPRVLEAMLPYFTEHFGNPSSGHAYGWIADEAVGLAREQLAALLGARPDALTFTSGATEAANLAIRGAAAAYRGKKDHVITLATGTLGFPGTVAAFSWIQDIVGPSTTDAASGD